MENVHSPNAKTCRHFVCIFSQSSSFRSLSLLLFQTTSSHQNCFPILISAKFKPSLHMVHIVVYSIWELNQAGGWSELILMDSAKKDQSAASCEFNIISYASLYKMSFTVIGKLYPVSHIGFLSNDTASIQFRRSLVNSNSSNPPVKWRDISLDYHNSHESSWKRFDIHCWT